MQNMRQKYEEEVVPEMMEQFAYSHRLEVPAIKKVVVNTGFGREVTNAKSNEQRERIIASRRDDLSIVAGQRPAITKARKSISGFRVREGQPVGAKVTLRGKRMHDFLDRVIHVALPRSRDFQGISTESVDQNGNLTFAIDDQTVFPEIVPEEITTPFSFEVTVVTEADDRSKAIALLRGLGFPLTEGSDEKGEAYYQ